MGGNYFTVPITARTAAERDRRVSENESRGFELVRTFEKEKTNKSWEGNSNRIGNESLFRFKGDSTSVLYCAVMRRDNTSYLEEKARKAQ